MDKSTKHLPRESLGDSNNSACNYYYNEVWAGVFSNKCLFYNFDKYFNLNLVLLLISNLTNELRLHQFLASKTT